MSLSDREDIEGPVCSKKNSDKYSHLEICEYGNVSSNNILITYGDSHLDAISYQLKSLALQYNVKIINARIKNCGIIFDITSKKVNFKKHYKYCIK